jgi:hypothetical protein
MLLCSSSEFWTNFCANALSDILFGVVFGSVFGVISTRLITQLIDARNTPDLSFNVEDLEGKPFIALSNWPPTNTVPASSEIQFRLENTGRVAAVNWLITIEFNSCNLLSGKTVFEFTDAIAPKENGPIIQHRREQSYSGKETVRLQYASPADIIHSGYKSYAPPNFRLNLLFHKGYEDRVSARLKNSTHKRGTYRIYADNMKTKEGDLTLIVRTEENNQRISFLFTD